MPNIVTLNTNIAFKRGNTLKNNAFTGPAGSISIDTDNNEIRIHDGTTAGGVVAGIKRSYSRYNLLPNGGFENGLNGWTPNTGNWTQTIHPSWGLCVTCSNISSLSGSIFLVSQSLPAEAGRQYTVACDSAFVGTGSTYCNMVFYNSSGSVLRNSGNGPIVGTHDFSDTGRYTHSVSETAPAGTVSVKIRLVASGVTTGASYLGFRQVKFEAGGLPASQYTADATIKNCFDKIPLDINNQIPDSYIPVSITSGFIYKGSWNASSNSPILPPAAGSNKNWYYKCTVAGTRNVTGASIAFNVGDWLISNGTSWVYLSGTDVNNSLCTILNALTVTNTLVLINNYLL